MEFRGRTSGYGSVDRIVVAAIALTAMQLDFTAADRAEARRLNARLDRLPRLRMTTAVGRIGLNLILQLVELGQRFPRDRRVRQTALTVRAMGRSVRLRIFEPVAGVRGVVLDLHGGGWTIGNARFDDAPNTELAARLGVAVVSVDYRRAVTLPISAQVDDCEAAAVWAICNIGARFGTRALVVKGASAGSHLAAAMLLRMRDAGAAAAVRGIVLYYGLYDFSGTPMVRAAGSATLLLDATTVRETLCKLTPGMTDDARRAPAISPLYADLGGLPRALFVVGADDMLLDDSRRMAARWTAASGNAEVIEAPDSPHAFTKFDTAVARKTTAAVDAWIVDRLDALPSRARRG